MPPDRDGLPRSLLHPRHWPAWLGLAAVWLIARLPFGALLMLGRIAGVLVTPLLQARRRVAAVNLALCFSGLDEPARAALLRSNLRNTGLMLVEFALGWMGSAGSIARVPVRVEGLEHLQAAHSEGRGVLLVGAHFSHLELCARMLAMRVPLAGMYRVMDSPVFEHAVLRARLGYASAMYTKDDLLGSIRHLRRGGVLWYAPDQDMRGKDSVFVPFFGIPAATITATHHLARLSGARVMPFAHRRLPGRGGYVIEVLAPLNDFPSRDPVADTARINGAIEAMVRSAPAQYLWMHKRFKTRPTGEEPPY